MRFGPVPLDHALGAILAHSVPLPQGRLRKGIVLGQGDLDAMRAAGLVQVTVARLSLDDLPEDEAALALARALVPDPAAARLRLDAVGTGRVNLIATGPGVLQVARAAIDTMNNVDPALTCATLPPLQRLALGDMAATVKVIAYGVAQDSVARACLAAAGTGAGTEGGALANLAPRLTTACLIQTRIDPADDGRKGREVTRARLARLDVDMTDGGMVAHCAQALAETLRAAPGDLVLVLTGSATSDLGDTAPEALRRAGGQVTHFGMPVDPGNLLFLGELRGRPVIGLPGCAKSPALNGADWVLERLICGLKVTPQDVMGMGVGGLLKEMPSRPHSRRARD
jgi:molybdenum cofactor cytidylyltransferase